MLARGGAVVDRYLRLTYRLPANLEEEWIAALWEAGTLGLHNLPASEEGEVRLEAWFAPSAPDLDETEWSRRGLRREAARLIEARDWTATWRRLSQPRQVGQRFVLDPREPEEVAAAGVAEAVPAQPRSRPTRRTLLRLPARNAFGSGSHESTRLAVELLEASCPVGAMVLDVGTGTGVLAFAALALGARLVVGFDIDPVAPVQARANARLNAGVLGHGRWLFFAGETAALRGGPHYDLALVNVLPGHISAALRAIAERLLIGGEMILSGFIEEQEVAVVERCARLGLVVRRTRREGEWVALSLERGGPA